MEKETTLKIKHSDKHIEVCSKECPHFKEERIGIGGPYCTLCFYYEPLDESTLPDEEEDLKDIMSSFFRTQTCSKLFNEDYDYYGYDYGE